MRQCVRLRIVIPGGSGQVGQVLARHFQRRGDHVTVLTRGPHTAEWQTVHWDAQTPGLWTQYLEGADVCINLTGRSVNCRYTPDNRVEIYNSRIVSTRLLGEVIASLAKSTPRLAQCFDGDHLPPCTRPSDGREDRRTRRR